MGIFIQWYGVNANSRMDVTRSIFNEGDLDITEYRNNTGDRSVYKGEYYSDKAPGLSLMTIPIYAGWKFTYSAVGNTSVKEKPRKKLFTVENIDITAPKKPGGFYLSLLIVSILFTSTLSVSIISILIYRMSGDVLENETRRIAVTFGFAFGTLITYYAVGFLPAAPAALFSFLPFYLIYSWDKHPGREKMILAGMAGGFGVVLKSTTALILASNALFAYLKYRKLPIYFTVGGFIGGLPYLIYNTIALGAPWRLPRNFLDPEIWPHLRKNSGFRLGVIREFYVSLRMLVMPYRGIFYWFPLLIIALPGFGKLYRDNRENGLIIGLISTGLVLLASSWWAWVVRLGLRSSSFLLLRRNR